MRLIVCIGFAFLAFKTTAQDANALVKQVKAKLEKVKDYSASAALRTLSTRNFLGTIEISH